MVLSLWLKATARVHPVHVMNMARRQAAADPQTRPNDPGCDYESACKSVGSQKPHPQSPFIIITQPES